MLNKFLNHLEEWLITTLIAVATGVVVVAVVHRYGTSLSIDTAKWAIAHGLPWVAPPLQAIYDWLSSFDLSSAQELCIYLFIWMAKFGAAYGVRTGIHIGVDVFTSRMPPVQAKKVILFGLLLGALFTGVIAMFGADFVYGVYHAGTRSSDLEAPMWIVYLAIPLGSSLMCYRFLQVAWHFYRRGVLPHHDVGHVDGIDAVAAPAPARIAPVFTGGGRMSLFLILLPLAIAALAFASKFGLVQIGGGLRTSLVFALLISLMLTSMPISISLGLTVLTFMFTLTEVPIASVAM